MRLGTLLLRDAVITLTQLEQSLRAQVVSGGLLGTNLVELGFLNLNTLGRYLARILDTPLAIADHFEKAEPMLIEALGAEMADRFSAVPLHFEEDEPNTIAIVMRNPHDGDAIKALSTHFNASVRPYVAPELRLFYYLERYYGIRRRTRFTRSPNDTPSIAPGKRERRATQPFHGHGQARVVNITPRKNRDTPTPAPVQLARACTFQAASTEVDAGIDRNEIGAALMRYTVGRFPCAALFMVRAGHALGWLAQVKGLGEDSLERLSLPLDAVSVFQTAHDSRKPYRGKLLTPGSPLERRFWTMCAINKEPTDLHVIPICIGERVVNLLYAHTAAETSLDADEANELIQLAQVAQAAYKRMVTRSSHQD